MVFEGSDKPRTGFNMNGEGEKKKLLLEVEGNEKYGSFPLSSLYAVPSTSYEGAKNLYNSSGGGGPRRLSKTRQREIVFVITLCCFVGVMLGLIFGLPPFLPYKVQYRFRKAAAVADSPHCSAIGRDLLNREGSAMDAAVAMVLCQGLVSPHLSGLGGGMYLLHYDQQRRNVSVMDALEGLPHTVVSRPEVLDGTRVRPDVHGTPSPPLRRRGPTSVAVPSQLWGLWNAHGVYGKLNWSDVTAPVIDLCNKGVEVHQELAESLYQNEYLVVNDKVMKEVFTNPRTGNLLVTGEIFHNERLCRALSLINSEGPEESLRGWFAMDLGAELDQAASYVAATDIAEISARWKQPVTSSFSARGRSFLVHTTPPPSDGLKTALALGVLDGFQLHREKLYEPREHVAILHDIVETFKFAFGFASEVDPLPRKQQLQSMKKLLSPKNLEELRESIDDITHPGNSYRYRGFSDLQLAPQDSEGSSVVVLADNGDIVIATSSLNSKFGSGMMSQSVGCIFNNQLDKFRVLEGAEYDKDPPLMNVSLLLEDPGRRIPSSAAPLLLEDKHSRYGVLMVAGSGGSQVSTSIVQTVANHLLFEEKLSRAVDLPRIHHQLHPDVMLYEEGSDMNLVEGLKERGHTVEKVFKLNAVVSAVRKMRDGSVIATYDRRGVGFADGF